MQKAVLLAAKIGAETRKKLLQKPKCEAAAAAAGDADASLENLPSITNTTTSNAKVNLKLFFTFSVRVEAAANVTSSDHIKTQCVDERKKGKTVK